MRQIYTEILIEASAAKVWQALTDFEAYSQWNTFIKMNRAEVKVGTNVPIEIFPPGKKASKHSVRILGLEPEHRLVWLGHFLSIPGLIDGEHIFEIQPGPKESVLLIHRENFRGVLIPFVWQAYLNTALRQGFEQFNQALKKFIEG